jgi:hypothetical protein
LTFYLSENDGVPVPAMLFLLVPAGIGTLKNQGSGRNPINYGIEYLGLGKVISDMVTKSKVRR